MHLSFLGPNPLSLFTFLLALPQLLSGGQQPSAVSQLGELSFTFGGQKSLMAVTFLVD